MRSMSTISGVREVQLSLGLQVFSQLHLLGLLSNHANDCSPHLHLLQELLCNFWGRGRFGRRLKNFAPAR